ncbi:fimbria/pilus periplasmic chaperone [Burkholderia ubonensis]|uniref:fimbria/pilus periplasmic chaperone n=1 Tax=Burkholderia ubonensis TaxID=101571 RepID=UPI00075ACABC|nr:fimbria/pilus periplasmic chaperone [Burkholderia ubonensis]
MRSTQSFRLRPLSLCFAILIDIISTHAVAGVIVSGTRFIYPAGDREITVKVDNTGNQPSLVQAWLDDGDFRSHPGAVKAPFVLMPPIFRVDPGKGQTLRIVYTGDPLPQDKESVFWLNVLDIPPKSAGGTSENELQLAFRSRIKVFFRPAGLDGDGAISAAKAVKWTIAAAPDGKGRVLRAINASPFNVIVLSIGIKHGGRTYKIDDGAMIAPHSAHLFAGDTPLPDLQVGSKFEYSTINDFGTDMKWQGVLQTLP